MPEDTSDTEDDTEDPSGEGGTIDKIEVTNHVSEMSFEDHVERLLHKRHPDANIIRQHHFPLSGRVADFIVELPEGYSWAMELENDAQSVLNGTGQAAYYASEAYGQDPSRGAVLPCLVVPTDHIGPTELHYIERQGIRVWQVDTPDDVDTAGV